MNNNNNKENRSNNMNDNHHNNKNINYNTTTTTTTTTTTVTTTISTFLACDSIEINLVLDMSIFDQKKGVGIFQTFLKGVVSCFDITTVLPDQAKIRINILCSWSIFGFSVS